MFKRHFLTRRRYDTFALTALFALLVLLDNASKLLFALFVFAGLYLFLSRHRSLARAPWAFIGAMLAYGAWTLVLIFARGEPLAGNRQIGFGLIALCCAFFPLGIVLVARPLTTAVSGARLGTVAVIPFAVFEFLQDGQRIGLGQNEAILAFLIAAMGVLSRLEVRDPHRFLPNGHFWFYMSAIPVVLTQTRAAWAVYAVALVFDGARLVLGRMEWRAINRPALIVVGACVLIAAVPGYHILNSTIQRGIAEYEAYSSEATALTSVGIRIAMWEGALQVIAEHPVAGVGSVERIPAVAERMPASADVLRNFNHLHNLVIDEMLINGLVGLALMILVFATFLAGVFRRTSEWTVRETSILLVLLIVTFGSFHGVMLHETTLIAMLTMMSVILVDLTRPYRNRIEAAGEGRGSRPAIGTAEAADLARRRTSSRRPPDRS